MNKCPLTLAEANAFVAEHHRHHKPVVGHKGAVNEDKIIGVVIVGRPVARMRDDGLTLEVTRLCTIRQRTISFVALELGLPEWLARLEDALFEGMSAEKAKTWPEVFLNAIPVGMDEDVFNKMVKPKFLVVVLNSVLESFDHKQFPKVKSAVEASIALWQRTDIGSSDWNRTAEAARAVAEAARAAVARAADWAAAEMLVRMAKYDYFADQLLEIIRNEGANK